MLRNRRQEAVVSGPLPGPSVAEAAKAAAVAGRLPVSWLTEAQSAGASGDGTGATGRSLVAAARDNVQTLARACWPGTLAPRLRSTALGFTFVAARHSGVGVLGTSEPAVAGMLQRLRLWGFPAARLTLEDGGWQPPAPGPLICYRPGSRVAAAALAGDLGLSPQSVVRSDDSPRRLVLVLQD